MSYPEPTPRDWRCRNCRALLGRVYDDHVEIRRKSATYRVDGTVSTDCRRCGQANVTRLRRPPGSSPPTSVQT